MLALQFVTLLCIVILLGASIGALLLWLAVLWGDHSEE